MLSPNETPRLVLVCGQTPAAVWAMVAPAEIHSEISVVVCIVSVNKHRRSCRFIHACHCVPLGWNLE